MSANRLFSFVSIRAPQAVVPVDPGLPGAALPNVGAAAALGAAQPPPNQPAPAGEASPTPVAAGGPNTPILDSLRAGAAPLLKAENWVAEEWSKISASVSVDVEVPLLAYWSSPTTADERAAIQQSPVVDRESLIVLRVARLLQEPRARRLRGTVIKAYATGQFKQHSNARERTAGVGSAPSRRQRDLGTLRSKIQTLRDTRTELARLTQALDELPQQTEQPRRSWFRKVDPPARTVSPSPQALEDAGAIVALALERSRESSRGHAVAGAAVHAAADRHPADEPLTRALSAPADRATTLPPLTPQPADRPVLTAREVRAADVWKLDAAWRREMVARNVDRTLLVGLIEQIDAEIERDLCEHYQDANKLLFDELVGAREPGATEALPTVPAALAPGANAAVRLAGIGDLITVEERLKAYIAGEIAHVENLVKGAKRSREHILTITDEETVETFRLSEKEARKSLETNTRTELSTTASQAAQESFAIDAGLNVSGQYGMTSVTATLDAQYQREQTEAESVATANVQEVIAKTEERFKTTESTLRRTLSHRQSKETNNETFQTDLTRSEIYLWVEQQREVRLLHKGSRMFVEYFVPEPAADLRQPTTAGGLLPPPALSISASELSEMNFAAYAAFYRAPGVDPPPAERVQVPFSYTSAVDKEAGHDQSDTSLVAITIPDGYVPSAVKFSAHGFEPQDEVHWFLSVGGQTMARETTWLEAATGLAPVLTRRKTLQLSVGAPQGMNAVLVVSGHFQKTAGLDGVLECRRSCELLAAWQLKTFTKLVQAHTALTEEYERAQRTRGVRPDLAGGPSTENRVTEKRELKKWCKTLLGALPPGNDPFVRGAPWSELDAAKASEQAFISEFFEKAFEWQEMTYFLFGYDVAPKARWSSLLASKSADPSHTAFLQAGAARVLVPVSPRFEPIIARYLQSTTVPTAQEIEEWQRQRLASEESQIDAITSQPSTLETVNLYLELLVARKPNVVVGSGALQMVQGSKVATLTDSLWKIGQIDVGRKVYIGTFESTVAKTDAGRNELELADAWRDVNDTVAFAVDAVQVGDSWSIVLPTPLIVHADALPTVDAINRQIAQRPWH